MTDKYCIGISNRTIDGLFLPFFDFDLDKSQRQTIILELKRIQNKFNLSTIYFIESTNGFNALSLDKLFWNELFKIIESTNYIDKTYIRIAKNRGYFTLRFGEDKKLGLQIPNNNIIYFKSDSHRQFIEQFFQIKIPQTNYFDKSDYLQIVYFTSEKHGYLELEFLRQKNMDT